MSVPVSIVLNGEAGGGSSRTRYHWHHLLDSRGSREHTIYSNPGRGSGACFRHAERGVLRGGTKVHEVLDSEVHYCYDSQQRPALNVGNGVFDGVISIHNAGSNNCVLVGCQCTSSLGGATTLTCGSAPMESVTLYVVGNNAGRFDGRELTAWRPPDAATEGCVKHTSDPMV